MGGLADAFGGKKIQDQKFAEFLWSHDGKSQIPWTVMSAVLGYAGVASKEYMLTCSLWYAVSVVDIFVRRLPECEEHGCPKTKVYPYIPIAMTLGLLSFLNYMNM